MNTDKTELEAQSPAFLVGAVSGSEKPEARVELVEVSDGVIFTFIYVPKGYKMKSHTLENHKTHYLGKLNSFNRIKLMHRWKTKNGCLVKAFTKILKSRGWDFDRFPNPTASVAIHCHTRLGYCRRQGFGTRKFQPTTNTH